MAGEQRGRASLSNRITSRQKGKIKGKKRKVGEIPGKKKREKEDKHEGVGFRMATSGRPFSHSGVMLMGTAYAWAVPHLHSASGELEGRPPHNYSISHMRHLSASTLFPFSA